MTTETGTMEHGKRMMRELGYTPSAGSWEDATSIHVFSVQTHGPATFGHPIAHLEYRKRDGLGRWYLNNRLFVTHTRG